MDRLYYQTLAVPAGTAISAAVSQAWPLEDNQLKEVTIEVPDGHCGLTGVRILQAQQQIVPFANSSYLVANGRTFAYPFDDEITSSGLVIQGFNTDIFTHTFYCTALVTNLPLPGELPEAEVVTASAPSSPIGYTTDDLSVDNILSNEPTPVIPTVPVTAPVTTSPYPPLPKPPVKKPGPIRRGSVNKASAARRR